jgi:hypothetical protein
MGIVKDEDVRGAQWAEGMTCRECMTDDEWNKLTQDEVIDAKQIKMSGDLYFCDRCKKQL